MTQPDYRYNPIKTKKNKTEQFWLTFPKLKCTEVRFASFFSDGFITARTATGMDGTLPHCSFENLKPVEITKNLFQHHLNILKNV